MNQILFHFWHVENGLENGAASRLDRRSQSDRSHCRVAKNGGQEEVALECIQKDIEKGPRHGRLVHDGGNRLGSYDQRVFVVFGEDGKEGVNVNGRSYVRGRRQIYSPVVETTRNVSTKPYCFVCPSSQPKTYQYPSLW